MIQFHQLLKVDSRLSHYPMFQKKLKSQQVLYHSHLDQFSADGHSKMERQQSFQSEAFLSLKKETQLLKVKVHLERLKLSVEKSLNQKVVLKKLLTSNQLQKNLLMLLQFQQNLKNQLEESQELSLFLLQVKEDPVLLQQITKQWQNSKEWLNLSNRRKQLVKNHRVKFLFHIKRLAKSEFLSKNFERANHKSMDMIFK